MSSLGSILNIARSALSTHQTAVRIASQNVSNAQTEGYSRQVVRLTDTRPDITPIGRLGTGVRIEDISRVRDTTMDRNYRREAGREAGFSFRFDMLTEIEGIMGEPSDTGLSAALDAFYDSWSDLSNHPTGDTPRRVVIQRSETLASTLNSFAVRIDDIAQTTRSKVDTAVAEINRITGQIATTNELIVREEASGLTASDLRDQRDRLVDSLSKLASVRATERANGTVSVIVENSLVVEGATSKALTAAGEPPVVQANGTNLTFASEGSKLGEMVAALNTRIPEITARLDELAEGLVVQTNALHNAGFLPDGTAAGDFFDPAGVTARTINVVATSATVAAGSSATAPNDNQIALAISAMRRGAAENTIAQGIWTPAEAAMLGGISAQEHYRSTVTDLAVDTRIAEDSATVFSTLASQLDLRRQSVSGVSVDEELIRVMQHQQSYTAAAKLVNVVDEMMSTVIELKR